MPSSRVAALVLVEGLLVQLLLGAPLIAGDDQTDGNERFKSLGKTWQSDLSRGYDIKADSALLLLERQPDGQSKFEYVVLPPKKLSEFQDAVNDGASRGFRLKRESVYRTGNKVGGLLAKARSTSSASASDFGARYEYRLSDASEKAITKLADEGFQVISIPQDWDDGYPYDSSVLERRVDNGARNAQQPLVRERYKLLTGRALEGSASKFREHVRNGYRVAFVSSSKEAILLERGPDQSPPPDYLLLRHRAYLRRQQTEAMMIKLEEDLNKAAFSGYRLLPDRIFFGIAGGRAFAFNEYVTILERAPEPTRPVKYMVISDLEALNKASETGPHREVSIVGTAQSRLIVEEPRK